MNHDVIRVVQDAIVGTTQKALVEEALRDHEFGLGFSTPRALCNNLSEAHTRGNLKGPLVVLLEHAVPGAARLLLPHYHLADQHSTGWSLAKVVDRVNTTVRDCRACKRQRRNGTRAAETLSADEFGERVADTQRRRRATKLRDDDWEPAGASGRHLTVVTGISGLALDRALAKLTTGPRGPRTVVDVDEHFCVLTGYLLDHFGFAPLWPEQPPLQRAFQLNAQVLQECWRLAFRSALTGQFTGPEAVGAKLAGLPNARRALRHGDVLLSCHLTWYDVHAHGFLVAGDMRELSRLARRTCRARLVTFVDDIFDVCARLISTGMYAHLDRHDDARLLDDLLRIVEWRRLEVLASEAAARAIDADCLIVPMKLPLVGVNRLVDGDRADLVYLSYSVGHPFETQDPEVEGEPWQKRVLAVSRALTEISDLAVVDATAVDEFRVREDGTYRDRWPLGAGKVLAVALAPKEQAFVDDPYGESAAGAENVDGSVRQRTRRSDSDDDKRTLRDQLLDLVQARGRALARQAGAIVLLRPFAHPGKMAQGMDIVSEQNRRLVEYADAYPTGLVNAPPPPHAPAVVFHTREDEWRRRVQVAGDLCLGVLDQYGGLGGLLRRLTDDERAAFRAELASRVDELDDWAAQPPREVGAAVQRIHHAVTSTKALRRSTGPSGRQANFDAAVAAAVAASVDVTRHPRQEAPEGERDRIPAFETAVFVVAASWQHVAPKRLARALADGIDRARSREAGVLVVHPTTTEWRLAGDRVHVDWSALGPA